MVKKGKKSATYQDVLAAPVHKVAEVIGGDLYTHPRPRPRHAQAASALEGSLFGPFGRGAGRPGGWWILIEPEIHLGAEPDIVVPDLAGWRRERLPEIPQEAYFTLRPDWLAEVLSPSTAQMDRTAKLPVYAREQIPYVWLVDPDAETLEVLKLDGSSYGLIAAHRGDAVVQAEPFEAVALELGALWGR
jgi:Uma2 family endonuclease